MMPYPQLWACLFFLMIILMGLDSQFVSMESLATSITDMFPKTLRKKYCRELLILAIAVLCFFAGLIMTTEGGLYIFQLFDYYAVSGTCMLFLATFEALVIAWIYGADRFCDNIEDMIGYRPPIFMKWCWSYFTPGVCIATFIFSLIKYTPVKYNNTYEYPIGAHVFGWFLALSSMLCVPLWALYKIGTTKGSLKQRIQHLILPADDLVQFKNSKKDPLMYCAPQLDFNIPPADTRDSQWCATEKESFM